MRINLHIQFEDETEKEITANAADLVAFEDKFNVSVTNLGESPRMSWLLYLAWHSEHRTKSTKLTYEDWLNTVGEIGASDTDPKSEG